MTRFGVDVEADVQVAGGQVDDEVRVVVHWGRQTALVMSDTAAGRVLGI